MANWSVLFISWSFFFFLITTHVILGMVWMSRLCHRNTFQLTCSSKPVTPDNSAKLIYIYVVLLPVLIVNCFTCRLFTYLFNYKKEIVWPWLNLKVLCLIELYTSPFGYRKPMIQKRRAKQCTHWLSTDIQKA